MHKYIVTVKFEVMIETEEEDLGELEFQLITGHYFPEKSSVISLKESLKKEIDAGHFHFVEHIQER